MEIWHYQLVSGLLFMLGMLGVLVRRNALVVLMSLELMLNGANLSLVAWARMWADPAGQVFAFMVIVVAAVELAVGLAIIVALVRSRETLNVEEPSTLKW